jgi:DNA-binding transcriptional ArsR family regulator
MHGVFEDDIAYRCARATETGLFGVFSDLHADVSVEDDLLQVSWADTVAPTADACVLTLTPSVFAWPGILLSQDGERVQVTYTARGVGRVWEDLGPRRLPRAVAALLGRSRSAILLLLAVPMSTTQVARTLDQSPAAVNRHLSILRNNGLVTSWRSGRNILYRRTALASSVLGR